MAAEPSAPSSPFDRFLIPLRRVDLWVAAILAAAFVLRLAWALHVDVDPRTFWRWDMSTYDYTASAMAAGKGMIDLWGGPSAHWPPGYPAALAPIYRLTNDSLLSARLFNVVMGVATVFLVYLLGKKTFDRRVGLLGAGVLAVFPGQVFATSLIMTEPLFTFLFMLILTVAAYALLGQQELTGRRALAKALIVGLLIGVAVLVRGEAVVLLVLIPALLLFGGRQFARRALAQSSLIVLGAAVVILPWTARNVAKMHAPIIISTSAAEALWVGHHEGANGRIADFAAVADEYKGMPNPDYEVKVNNKALKEALQFIKGHPATEVTLVPKRFVALYAGDGSSIAWMDNPPTLSANGMKWLGRLSDWYYWAIGAMAALGIPLWLSLRDERKLLLAATVAGWTALFCIVFFGDERFHFAIMPIFALWAAVSMMFAWDWLRRKRERRLRA
jgi:4-amino-4-deoxy-L-arabinose transferase-like glycosyltransferase